MILLLYVPTITRVVPLTRDTLLGGAIQTSGGLAPRYNPYFGATTQAKYCPFWCQLAVSLTLETSADKLLYTIFTILPMSSWCRGLIIVTVKEVKYSNGKQCVNRHHIACVCLRRQYAVAFDLFLPAVEILKYVDWLLFLIFDLSKLIFLICI